jgi:hypothetical protein
MRQPQIGRIAYGEIAGEFPRENLRIGDRSAIAGQSISMAKLTELPSRPGALKTAKAASLHHGGASRARSSRAKP